MNLEKLTNQIKQHEGFAPKVYTCSQGKLTIGYGRNLEEKGITKAEAEILLNNDIKYFCNGLKKHSKFKHIFIKLNTNRQAVLINMCFTLGVGGLSKFVKMWAALNCGNFKKAASEMLDSKWARQVKTRAIQLANQMKQG